MSCPEVALLPRTTDRPARECGNELLRSQPKPRSQSYGVNVLDFPGGQRRKATDVTPWYGVYQKMSWRRTAVVAAIDRDKYQTKVTLSEMAGLSEERVNKASGMRV